MTIDCSLDNFRYPGLPTYGITFGTKKVSGEGLSTAECCDDMAMPFNRQRPYIVTETSDTTELEANSVFCVTASGVTLTLADAAFDGCRAVVINASTGSITVKGGVSGLNGGPSALTLAAKEIAYLIYYSGWQTAYMTYGGQLSAPNAAAKNTHLVRKQEHDADIKAAKELGNAAGVLAIANGGTGAATAQAAANATVGAAAVDTATTDSEYLVKAAGSTIERMTMANFWKFLSNKVKALKVDTAIQADNAAKLNNKAESALAVSYAANAGKLNNKAESALSVSYAASAGKVTPPVGFVYVQFSGQSAPNALWGGTWQNVSNLYAGLFFRAEGGNAAAFGSSQREGLPNISGLYSASELSERNKDVYATGCLYDAGNHPWNNWNADGEQNGASAMIGFNASRSSAIYGASSHVTPVNSTIRVWKRTA